MVRKATPVDKDGDAFDVSALTEAPDRQQIHEDGRTASANSLPLGPELVSDASRLPENVDALVALRPSHRDGEAWVQFVIVVDDRGDVAFAGNCANRFYKKPLTRYRDEVRPSDALEDVFHDVVTDQLAWADFNDFDLQEVKYSPPTFDQKDPKDRQIDQDTPVEVLNGLTLFEIDLEVPAEWVRMPGGALCTFVAEGWNECFALEALIGEDSTVAELSGFGTIGGTVEVWLVDYINLGIDAPVGLVGSFLLPAAEQKPITLRAVGSRGSSLDDVAAELESGDVHVEILALSK